jgi:hypothetical protein
LEELRPDPTTCRLRLGASLLRSTHMCILLIGSIGLPLIALVGIVYRLETGTEGPPDAPAIWAAIWVELVNDPGNRAMLWAAAVLLPIGIAFIVLQSRAYLRITAWGLEAHIPRWLEFGAFRQTAGRWAVRWDEIRGIRLHLPSKIPNAVQRLGACRLELETPQGQVRVAAFRWFDGEGLDHRLGLGELIAFRKLDVLDRLQSAPLVRAGKARGLDIGLAEGETETPTSGFDLAKHKGMLAQVCLFFAAGLYAIAATFFAGGYMPLDSLPALPFAVAGIVAAIAAARLGRGAPMVERTAVGTLCVGACVAAAYPATLQYNASTAEAEIVTYVSAGAGRFEARVDGLPAIDLSGEDLAEYWSEYPAGATHEFTLLRGAAGVYQLEMAPFYERTRQFYRDRRNEN